MLDDGVGREVLGLWFIVFVVVLRYEFNGNFEGLDEAYIVFRVAIVCLYVSFLEVFEVINYVLFCYYLILSVFNFWYIIGF